MGEVPSDIFRSGSRFDGARCMEDEPQRCASTVRVLRGSVTFGEKEHFVKFALGAVFVDFGRSNWAKALEFASTHAGVGDLLPEQLCDVWADRLGESGRGSLADRKRAGEGK